MMNEKAIAKLEALLESGENDSIKLRAAELLLAYPATASK